MAQPYVTLPDPTHLHALVDMGSNGIRFSISNLSSPTARLIPTIYQSRSSISIYDAQFSDTPGKRVPIHHEVIADITSSLRSFLRTCKAFQVPDENIRVLATEATRTAPNSDEFQRQVKAETGLNIQLLSKEDEGRIGALGIVSSFPAPIKGIVLDLGGGSTQISWLRLPTEGDLQRSESAVSMPYGAAAMIGRLESGTTATDLSIEIEQSFRDALQQLKIPEDMITGEGLTLYLSGGGFRGWGYALMDRHYIQPYPIPIINGFEVSAKNFDPRKIGAEPVSSNEFRISSRRASQSPAVQLLISSLLKALPKVSTIYFAQGGVREGSLFSLLPQEIQSQHPLLAATLPYARPAATKIASLIQAAIPLSPPNGNLLPFLSEAFSGEAFIQSLSNLIHHHGTCPKDIRPSAALRSTTTGLLSSTHGLTHEARAWLALALLARWTTVKIDLPKTDHEFYTGLSMSLGREEAWWAGYVGRIAAVVGERFPAGIVSDIEWKMVAKWAEVGKKHKRQGIELTIDFGEEGGDDDNVAKAVKQLVKWGKGKNWDERIVYGCKIVVRGDDEDSE